METMKYLITNKENKKLFLDGKIVIITGASGDIGIAMCESLLENGASISVVYNKGKERIEELKKKFPKKKIDEYQVDFLSGDWRDRIENIVKQIFRKYGRIDILLNVAGIWHVTPFLYESEEMHEKIMRVNYESARIFSKEVIKNMIGKPGIKHIINIASTAGLRGVAQQVSYSNSKAALISLTQATAEEYANYGINVNAISPGPVDTRAIEQYVPGEKAKKLLAKSIPKYALCKVEDVVNAMLGILMNDYLTGANIILHGGR